MNPRPLFDHQLSIRGDQVLADGHELALSPRAHQALILFLKSAGQVLSKEHLLQQLWDGVIVSDDSLFKVIQEIRQAIRQLGIHEPVLNNVYGKGYQWVAPESVRPAQSARYWPRVLIMGLLLVSVATVWWLDDDQPPAATDEWYQTQLVKIRAGTGHDLPDLATHANASVLTQLQAAHLHGLVLHRSGQYDASIGILNQGLSIYAGKTPHQVAADVHYLLSRMYIYRDDRATLKRHLDEAERLYLALGDENGLLDVAVERARYHQVLLEFTRSVELLNAVYQQASETDNAHHKLRALSNLAYAHQQLGQPAEREAVLQEALELALGLSDGGYAAYCYGELAEIYALRREYTQAMKHAELALRYVMNQPDTNVFQQGFSAFYLLLRPLGHTVLAERYLQQAIEVQQSFNDQGVLVNAELNLAKIYLAQGKAEVGFELLNALLAEQLTTTEQLEAEALLAYSLYMQGDNIGAYTRARPVLEAEQTNRQASLYAQAAFVLGAWQLERGPEAGTRLQAMASWIEQTDLDELTLFLQVAEATAAELVLPDWGMAERQSAATSLTNKRQQVIRQTQPDAQLIQDLDQHLSAIKQ